MIDLLVIGAGPAGVIAAGIAAEKGKDVVILEKMKKPLLKLGITGKGRCNLTNNDDIKEILKKFNSGNRFLKYAINEFSNKDLMEFFEKHGVKLKVERGNRVFPQSNKAFEIVGALKDWIKSLGVKIILQTEIEQILVQKNQISGVVYQKKGKTYKQECKNLLIATGGKSYPRTGSTGDGYQWAKLFGHKIVSPHPSLVPLTTETKTHGLNNLKLKNISASFWSKGKKVCDEFGELYFTDFGVDGPVVLTMSNDVINSMKNDGKVELSIDLKPSLSHKKIKNRLIREIENKDNKILIDVMKKLLPEKLVNYCFETLNLQKNRKCTEITAEERKRVRLWLKDFRIKITSHRSIDEAIVTAGGIHLKEVDTQTMRSKKVNNLFFAGEILDIDAKTGGYNLQAAFSTGYVVGKTV